MSSVYWHKQERGKPLFPDLLWSRPETKRTAGKLLIVGGNLHGFAAAANAHAEAQKAGIGSLRVLLPDALQKTLSKLLPEAVFAPSTASGSLGQKALPDILEHSQWSDGVLLAGDFGRNSETAILLENFVAKSKSPLTITKDAVDYFTNVPQPITNRPGITCVLTMAQLQRLVTSVRFHTAFTFDMDLLRLVDALHTFTGKFSLSIIVQHLDTVFVAVSGQVSTTKTNHDSTETWRIPTAAHAAVWWLQNPTKPFEALTTSVITE